MRLRYPDFDTNFWSDVNNIQLDYNMDRDANHPHEDSHDHQHASSSHNLDLGVDSLSEASIDELDGRLWRPKQDRNMQFEQEDTQLLSTKDMTCTPPEVAGSEEP